MTYRAAYGWKSYKSIQIEQIFAAGGDIYKIGVTPIGGNSYERKTYYSHIMNHKYICAYL